MRRVRVHALLASVRRSVMSSSTRDTPLRHIAAYQRLGPPQLFASAGEAGLAVQEFPEYRVTLLIRPAEV